MKSDFAMKEKHLDRLRVHDEQEPTLLSVEKGGSWRSSWGKQVIEAEYSSCILGPNSYNVLNS